MANMINRESELFELGNTVDAFSDREQLPDHDGANDNPSIDPRCPFRR